MKRSSKRQKRSRATTAAVRAPFSIRCKAALTRQLAGALRMARRLDRVASGRPLSPRQFAAIGLFIASAFCWSYWPVIASLWRTWGREADYSHGYLVVPAACGILWQRRGSRPTARDGFSLWGLALLTLSCTVRVAGALWYVDAFESWSLLLWAGGMTWMLGGAALIRWSLPAILFLGFMIPLPFRVDQFLSLPLQRVAAGMSCWLLQCLGEPAITEGNVVIVNNTRLLVAEACSGLRILMSIFALAYAWCALLRRPWQIKAGVMLSVLPIALLANSLRIVATGLVEVHISSEAAHRFAHDAAGWLMLPLAAAMMAGVDWYTGKLLIEVETLSTQHLFQRREASVHG